MTDSRIRSKTNYIFTFGRKGVGKSTFLSAICRYLSLHRNIDIIPNLKNNNEGAKLYYEWLENLKFNKFPERTRISTITQIELGLRNLSAKQIVPVSFLEMSGEDLHKIDIRKRDKESDKLIKSFIQFISNSSIFILITEPEHVRHDDTLFRQFITHIRNYAINPQIALVVSKYDQVNEYNLDEVVEDIIENEMEYTAKAVNLLKDKTSKAIFPYSIGVVENDIIKSIDDELCGEIADWLYNALVKTSTVHE